VARFFYGSQCTFMNITHSGSIYTTCHVPIQWSAQYHSKSQNKM